MQTVYASDKQKTKRVWYSGTDQLKEGYALCYDQNYGTATVADEKRGYVVEKPATANLKYFAGLVSAADDGKTGPCEITINEPDSVGRLVNAYTSVNCTINVSLLAITNASYILVAPSSANVTVGIAMQTVDRSSTNGTVMCKLEGAKLTQIDTAALPAVTAAALTGTLTGTVNGALVDIAATAGSCAGGSSPTAGNVDTAIATAVATIVSGANEQIKELQTTINALIVDLAATKTALINANQMAAS